MIFTFRLLLLLVLFFQMSLALPRGKSKVDQNDVWVQSSQSDEEPVNARQPRIYFLTTTKVTSGTVFVSTEATCYTTTASVSVCDTTVVAGKKKKREATDDVIDSVPKFELELAGEDRDEFQDSIRPSQVNAPSTSSTPSLSTDVTQQFFEDPTPDGHLTEVDSSQMDKGNNLKVTSDRNGRFLVFYSTTILGSITTSTTFTKTQKLTVACTYAGFTSKFTAC